MLIKGSFNSNFKLCRTQFALFNISSLSILLFICINTASGEDFVTRRNIDSLKIHFNSEKDQLKRQDLFIKLIINHYRLSEDSIFIYRKKFGIPELNYEYSTQYFIENGYPTVSPFYLLVHYAFSQFKFTQRLQIVEASEILKELLYFSTEFNYPIFNFYLKKAVEKIFILVDAEMLFNELIKKESNYSNSSNSLDSQDFNSSEENRYTNILDYLSLFSALNQYLEYKLILRDSLNVNLSLLNSSRVKTSEIQIESVKNALLNEITLLKVKNDSKNFDLIISFYEECLIDLYLIQNDLNSANAIISRKLLSVNGDKIETLILGYKNRINYFNLIRNPKEEDKYLRLLFNLKKSSTYTALISNLITNFSKETYIKKKLDYVTASNRTNSTLLIFALLIVSILLIVCLFGFWYNHDKKNKLNQKNKQLEGVVFKLSQTQNQLVHAEKLAALGELTAGIAHEIQNPLNFVNNFAEVNAEIANELITEIDKEQYSNTLIKELTDGLLNNSNSILQHGKRASAIVKSMLSLSRNSPGERIPTDLNKFIGEYINLVWHSFRANYPSFNGQYKTDYDPLNPKVFIIQQDFSRVLINIFQNAYQSCLEKAKTEQSTYQPYIFITTKTFINTVEIQISDNGMGIPKEIQDKIFLPFFSTKKGGEGTGLGLSISSDIVKSHGGEIKVESTEKRYAVFIIRLPLYIEKENVSSS